MFMTEARIEREAERKVDRLRRLYMDGKLRRTEFETERTKIEKTTEADLREVYARRDKALAKAKRDDLRKKD
jgi:hypothetical protein